MKERKEGKNMYLRASVSAITQIISQGLAKDQNPQKPAKIHYRFIASRPPHQKIILERGETEQKSSDIWTNFQQQERWIAVAETNVSYIPRGKPGIKGVSEPISSVLFSHLLHHCQIFVWTREKKGSESKNTLHF